MKHLINIPLIIMITTLGCSLDTEQESASFLDGFVRVESSAGTIILSNFNPAKHKTAPHVGDGYSSLVLTGAHVLENSPEEGEWTDINIQIPTFNKFGREVDTEYIQRAFVLELNEELDYAILMIQTKNLHKATRTAPKVRIDNIPLLYQVISIGCPGGQEVWASVGYTANVAPKQFPGLIGHESKIFLGNSGGPLYNHYGEQIGINQRVLVNQFAPEERTVVTHVGFAVKLSEIYRDLGTYKTILYFGESK